VREQSRLVAFNPALDINCALLVDRLAGLRSLDQLRADPHSGPRPAFAGRSWTDSAGRNWQELQLSALAGHDAFLKVAR
jgi:twitching motility protein PilI